MRSAAAVVDLRNISIATLTGLALSGRVEFLGDEEGWLVAASEFQATTPAGQWPLTSIRVETGTNDDGKIVALRMRDWKVVFFEQRAKAMMLWAEPFVELRVPKIFNLRRDPYERSYRTSNTYYDWLLDRAYLLVPAQAYVGDFLATFKDYPPRQKAASFSLDQVMEMLTETAGAQ